MVGSSLAGGNFNASSFSAENEKTECHIVNTDANQYSSSELISTPIILLPQIAMANYVAFESVFIITLRSCGHVRFNLQPTNQLSSYPPIEITRRLPSRNKKITRTLKVRSTGLPGTLFYYYVFI